MDEQEEALSARANARLGTTLRGKYRLDRVLGIGGMATVYAATHRNQAELAVKLLHPELSLREDLKKRFLREGYVGNSVKHPGAVLVVDDDIAEDGSAFLVMELLRGKSVEDLWEQSGRRLSSRVATALGVQLLEVLVAAHEKAIIHRDLKPANLFLTLDGTVKVLDFGIARLRDAVGGSEHATRTGTLMGTPAFMAPEQAQAVTAEIDAQTDLWAVGATLYTLLSGELVHEGDNSSQLLIRAATTRARPLLSVAPDVEPPIAEVVDRALAFEKASRWPSADAMLGALVEASRLVHGQVPGRDALTGLVDGDVSVRRSDNVQVARRAGRTTGSGVMSPRLVVSGREGAGGSDPTFATPPDKGPSQRAPALAPPASTKISEVPHRRGVPGGSTSNPVSAEHPQSQRPRRRSGTGLGIAIGVGAAVVIGGVAFALLRPGGTTVTLVTGAPSAPSASAAPTATTTAPAAPPTTGTATTITTASATTTAPPTPTPTATAAETAAAAKTPKTTAAPASTKAAPAAAVDCSTPYTLDADGKKKWKMECLH
jgi:serine/threonine-protein kinase